MEIGTRSERKCQNFFAKCQKREYIALEKEIRTADLLYSYFKNISTVQLLSYVWKSCRPPYTPKKVNWWKKVVESNIREMNYKENYEFQIFSVIPPHMVKT